MTDLITRLATALGTRYQLERELGRGGNAVVYLALDRKHDRKVAIKVLLPELAQSVRTERFLREIQIAAKLSHPHILLLIDSGEVDGCPYYVMPYVAGESLRERLRRTPQLPVEEALQIARQVGSALEYAHAQAVVHRDIKPENILLQSGHAVVADFGIARALTAAVGDSVTQTGIVVGTPLYMSPEQASGDKAIDGRSDIYSLGCVLYEMLAGQPPFTGSSAQQIIGHHLLHPPTPLRKLRAEIPASVEGATLIALAKDPAERFATVAEFATALGPSGHSARLRARTRRARRWWPAAAAGLLVVALLGAWVAARSGKRQLSTGSPTLVAVLPFAVQGSADIAYLGEGLVSLLSTSLDGAGNLRAVDPHAILNAVRRPQDPAGGASMAERLGAGLYILGDVVEAGGRVRIGASLYEREHGSSPRASATVEGTRGEVFSLVDGLATQLLAGATSGPTARVTRVASVTTSSLAAYKAYLDGEAALRVGRADSAVIALERATTLDTAFALAYYRLSVAAEWATRAALAEWSAEQAVHHSAHLAEHDRLLLRALLTTRRGAGAEAEGLYRDILGTYPDDIDAWIQLGEVQFHYGPTLGTPVAASAPAFERVLFFQPDYVSAMVHLARIAAMEGRAQAVDSLVANIEKLSPSNDRTLEMRVLRAYATHDTAAQRGLEPDIARAGDAILTLPIWDLVVYVGDWDGAEGIARALADPGRSRDAQAAGHTTLAYLALARGRLEAARLEMRRAATADPVRALEYGTLLELTPVIEPRRGTLEAARQDLERWNASAVPPSALPMVYFNAHDGVHPLLRAYLLGVVNARLGDITAAERQAAVLNGQQAPPTALALPRDLALEVQAEIGLAQRSPGVALAALRQRKNQAWYEFHFASPFFSGSRGRFVTATLEAAQAKSEEDVRRAILLFSTFEGYSGYDYLYAGPARFRRAALYQRLGDRKAAARDYERFLELWKDCDREFRPLLDSARTALAGLN